MQDIYQTQISNLTIPYTYYLKWTKTNKKYYGVRHTNKSYVGDIMIDYFTSSKYVKQYIKEHGKPDIVIVDRCFNSKDEAVKYENEFLLSNKAAQSEEWLNKSNGYKTFGNCGGYTLSEETKKKLSIANKGKTLSEEHKKKIGIANKGKTLSGEAKLKMSIAKKSKVFSEEHKLKLCEKAKLKKKFICPHCNKEFDASHLKQWHGDKCKLNRYK